MTQKKFEAVRKREGEYWDRRFRTVEEVRQKKIEEFTGRADRLFEKAYRRIDQKLHLFFAKFADVDNISYAEAKKLLTDPEIEDFKMELDEYIATAARNAKYYSPEVAKELEKASLRYRVTRLEAMEYQLKAILSELFSGLAEETDIMLAELYQDQYSRTAYEIFRGTGVQKIDFSIPDRDGIELLIRKPWRADGADFSERYGSYRTQLVSDLSDCLSRVIINGEGYQGAARELEKKIGPNKLPGTERFKARRLIHTEAAYFSGIAQNECFKELGVEKYQFRSELNLDVCDNCQDMDGEIFDIKDRRVGVNAPPMHPFCVLPDTRVLAPGCKLLYRSHYTGDVIKIKTEDGRELSVTPNHILLTESGFVRAKNLTTGDKLLAFSKDKLPSGCSIGRLDELCRRDYYGRTVKLPSDSYSLKGDGEEGGIIDVTVFCYSRKLIKTFNPQLYDYLKSECSELFEALDLFEDFELYNSRGENLFSADMLLRALALASDMYVSPEKLIELFSNIQRADSFTSDMQKMVYSTEAQLMEIMAPGRYNYVYQMRVLQTEEDFRDESSLNEFLTEFGKNLDDILCRISIDSIESSFYDGDVFDTSTPSTMYLCNGIISSNCRCVSVPYIDNSNIPGYVPEMRSGRDSKGKSVLFREDITYKEWYEQYGRELEEKRKKK